MFYSCDRLAEIWECGAIFEMNSGGPHAVAVQSLNCKSQSVPIEIGFRRTQDPEIWNPRIVTSSDFAASRD